MINYILIFLVLAVYPCILFPIVKHMYITHTDEIDVCVIRETITLIENATCIIFEEVDKTPSTNFEVRNVVFFSDIGFW